MIRTCCDRIASVIGAASTGVLAAGLWTTNFGINVFCQEFTRCTNSTATDCNLFRQAIKEALQQNNFGNVSDYMSVDQLGHEVCELYNADLYIFTAAVAMSIAALHLTYRSICCCDK